MPLQRLSKIYVMANKADKMMEALQEDHAFYESGMSNEVKAALITCAMFIAFSLFAVVFIWIML